MEQRVTSRRLSWFLRCVHQQKPERSVTRTAGQQTCLVTAAIIKWPGRLSWAGLRVWRLVKVGKVYSFPGERNLRAATSYTFFFLSVCDVKRTYSSLLNRPAWHLLSGVSIVTRSTINERRTRRALHGFVLHRSWHRTTSKCKKYYSFHPVSFYTFSCMHVKLRLRRCTFRFRVLLWHCANLPLSPASII